MATLMQASSQWASRPADQRFLSLTEMMARMEYVRDHSHGVGVSSRSINLIPANEIKPGSDPQHKGLLAVVGDSEVYAPTHHSFGQLATLSESPAGYLRTLPSPLAADCVNFGMRFKRGVQDVGMLLYRNDLNELRAATGPNYGRIWNADIISSLVDHVGDGVTGNWRVPGEFGEAVEVTKENTTLYASDRDMFVFLADEQHKIEMPNRRNGAPGQLSRGFFVWNSEVGDKTFGIATFLFDYVCKNRIVWGAEGFKEIKIRHTSGAPDRWLDEVRPALQAYAQSTESTVLDTVKAAQAAKVPKIDDFLKSRFSLGRNTIQSIRVAHEMDEGRPMETLWDITTGITAYARSIPHQDERVKLERVGGEVMELATA